MKIPIPRRFRKQSASLDELVGSLPVLRDKGEPDNRENQALVLPVEYVDGVLHVQYLHEGSYVERPVSFSYMDGRTEVKFGLSDMYQRIPSREESVVIPLTAHEQGLPVRTDPSGNPIEERSVHGLGIKVDDKHVLPLFIYNRKNARPTILLCAEQEYNFLDIFAEDTRREIDALTKPIQDVKRHYRFDKLSERKTGELDWSDAPSIVGYLNKYIIGQPHAKRAIAVAFSNYMVRRDIDDEDLPKDNLLLIGGTGTGKTQSMRLLAEKARIPFFKTQMTGKSSAGYVGDPFLKFFNDVARNSRSSSPYGIVFLDEMDKLIETRQGIIRGELQGELIGILEDGYVAGISTKNILFVAAGAFSRGRNEQSLRQIISQRTGVGADSPDLLQSIQQHDIIEYGLMEELVGRLPVIGVFDHLSVDDKIRILTESKGSVLNSYLKMFEYKGYQVEVHDDFPRFVAEHTAPETGARGLHSVCNEILQEVFYDPSAFAEGRTIHLTAGMAGKTMQLYRKD